MVEQIDLCVLPTAVTVMRLAGGRGGRRQRHLSSSFTFQLDKVPDPSTADSTQEHHSHFHS